MNKNLKDIIPRELIPGYHGKLIHSDNMTLAFWNVAKGKEAPAHQHSHEQILYVIEGEFEFFVNEEKKLLKKDDTVVIPSNTLHGGKAITECKLLDIFNPCREDLKDRR